MSPPKHYVSCSRKTSLFTVTRSPPVLTAKKLLQALKSGEEMGRKCCPLSLTK